MMNEIRRIQARIDWFMKAQANRNARQEQPRARTRERRPVCDICGRVGHVRQNCYARVDQRNQYHNPQTNQPHPQSGPRIAALETKDTSEPSVAQFNHQYPLRVNALFARACDILKSEFTKPALNSKLQGQSDQTHFTLSTVKRKRENQKPMQTLSLILPSRKSR